MAHCFPDTGKQISPCILAQERYGLGFKIEKPENKKKCSQQYREKVRKLLLTTNNFTR